MKKLTTLLVMLLFTAGMAIAQNNNVAEQVQNGTGSNEAFIEQSRFMERCISRTEQSFLTLMQNK